MTSNSLTLNEARRLLLSFSPSLSLIEHCEDVGWVMRHIALTLSVDEHTQEKWQIAGLLHDADWEASPSEHPKRIAGILVGLGEHEIADAILTHYTGWGRAPSSLMGSALLAVDELTGFVRAYLVIRSSQGRELTFQDVQRKLKDRSFARSVEREEVARCIAQSPVSPDRLIPLIARVLSTGRPSGVV